MTRSPAAAAAWVQGGPARTINGGDWEGGCVAAVYNAGGFARSYNFAVEAAVAAGAVYAGGHSLPATGSLNKNPAQAGDGSVHYYGGIWNGQYVRWDGHVTFQYGGRMYMASTFGRVQYGHHLSSSTWQEYQDDRGLPYLGHSPYFGTQPFAGVDPAALQQTGLDNTLPVIPPEEDMKLITQETGGQPALVGEFAFYIIDAETMSALEPVFGPHVQVTDYAWQYLHDRAAENHAALAAVSSVVDARDDTAILAAIAGIKIPAKGTIQLA